MELALSAPSYQISKIKQQDQAFDRVTVPGTFEYFVPGQPQLPIASFIVEKLCVEIQQTFSSVTLHRLTLLIVFGL
jgi:hypothetical protein